MKLRCITNSIRIRIRKSELEQLAKEGRLEEEIHFPAGNRFSYALLFREGEEKFTAQFAEGQLIVQLPAEQTLAWANADQVSMEAALALPDGHQLNILVEKDFPCKDRIDEDKTDFFGELADQNDAVC